MPYITAEQAQQIILDALEETRVFPNMRYGQCVYNRAFLEAPEAIQSLTGSSYDCYYDDSKVMRFLEAAKGNFDAV